MRQKYDEQMKKAVKAEAKAQKAKKKLVRIQEKKGSSESVAELTQQADDTAADIKSSNTDDIENMSDDNDNKES